jgi:hypothetical protein
MSSFSSTKNLFNLLVNGALQSLLKSSRDRRYDPPLVGEAISVLYKSMNFCHRQISARRSAVGRSGGQAEDSPTLWIIESQEIPRLLIFA